MVENVLKSPAAGCSHQPQIQTGLEFHASDQTDIHLQRTPRLGDDSPALSDASLSFNA
jgi:hypothetical protein